MSKIAHGIFIGASAFPVIWLFGGNLDWQLMGAAALFVISVVWQIIHGNRKKTVDLAKAKTDEAEENGEDKKPRRVIFIPTPNEESSSAIKSLIKWAIIALVAIIVWEILPNTGYNPPTPKGVRQSPKQVAKTPSKTEPPKPRVVRHNYHASYALAMIEPHETHEIFYVKKGDRVLFQTHKPTEVYWRLGKSKKWMETVGRKIYEMPTYGLIRIKSPRENRVEVLILRD